MNFNVSVVVLCFASISCEAQKLVFDHSTPAVEDRGLVVGPGQLVPQLAQSYWREFINASVHRGLARLTITESVECLDRAMIRDTGHPNYDNTVHDIRALGLPDLPVAQILIINGEAYYSFRDQKKLIQRGPDGEGDRNFVQFRELGTGFELLHFVLTPPGPALPPTAYSMTVYVRATPKVSISACAGLTKRLAALTQADLLSLEVRADTWFMESL